jgi:hypothetical protein
MIAPRAVGLDVNEIAPAFDGGKTAALGAKLIREFVAAVAACEEANFRAGSVGGWEIASKSRFLEAGLSDLPGILFKPSKQVFVLDGAEVIRQAGLLPLQQSVGGVAESLAFDLILLQHLVCLRSDRLGLDASFGY